MRPDRYAANEGSLTSRLVDETHLVAAVCVCIEARDS
jgi:hypothetical protein